MDVQIDTQDLIEMLTAQRNEALNSVAQTNAALKGAYREIGRLKKAIEIAGKVPEL